MARIKIIPAADATGTLKALYEKLATADGSLDEILAVHSLNPRSLDDHHRLYAHLMRGPSGITRVQREMIAVTVSAANDCFY